MSQGVDYALVGLDGVAWRYLAIIAKYPLPVADQGFLEGGSGSGRCNGTHCRIMQDGGSTLSLVMQNIVEALYVYAEVAKQSMEKFWNLGTLRSHLLA